MTGDDDDDDRPDQTRTNANRMDHAICDDLAAVVVPSDSCRPPKVQCHSCDHEDRLPDKPARWQRFGLGAVLRASEGSNMALMPLRRRMIDDMTIRIMSRKQCHQQSRLGTSAIGTSATCDGVAATTAFFGPMQPCGPAEARPSSIP